MDFLRFILLLLEWNNASLMQKLWLWEPLVIGTGKKYLRDLKQTNQNITKQKPNKQKKETLFLGRCKNYSLITRKWFNLGQQSDQTT